jgi:hypothetical protein
MVNATAAARRFPGIWRVYITSTSDASEEIMADPVPGEAGTRTLWALAEELDDDARAGLWPKLIAESPAIGEFQAKTRRQIPVFVLTPEEPA